MENAKGNKPKRKPLPQPPPLRSSKSRDFTGSLESIRSTLGLTPSEFKALRRALFDSETRKPKTKSQHDEDESWLDWALKAAKKYGPQLVELLAGA